ncbi:MAG: sulfite exporter TauE/SafE family protein [Bacteroidia bacterium]|nr:sulfite exporter TauE/SafE family protein [Bacteroidia bacterium]
MEWVESMGWFAGMGEIPWTTYAVILVAGIVTGVINTLAGSGSLITLPIFVLLCGLPATVANGTNRVGVIIQSLVGVGAYRKSGKLQLQHVEWLAIPAIVGAIIGAQIAVKMNEQMMNIAIGGLMIFMLGVLLVNPERWIKVAEVDTTKHKSAGSVIVFFLIGMYGGFIQAGVGIFLLAGLVLSARYALSAANGIKMLLVLLFNLPAFISFFLAGQVHLGFGLLMAGAQAIGAVIGVRFIARIPNANLWIHRLLIVIVLASAIKFISMAFL